MTANQDTCTNSDNSGDQTSQGAVGSDADRIAIIEHLRQHGGSILREQLLADSGVPASHLDDVLRDLEEQDIVSITAGRRRDLIRLHDTNAKRAEGRSHQSATPIHSTTDLSEETVFHILSNPRRRAAIRALVRAGPGGIGLGDLVEAVAGDEADVHPSQVTTEQRKRVWISMYQSHVPVLDEAGVVEWDRDQHRLRAREPVHLLATLLTLAGDGSDGEQPAGH